MIISSGCRKQELVDIEWLKKEGNFEMCVMGWEWVKLVLFFPLDSRIFLFVELFAWLWGCAWMLWWGGRRRTGETLLMGDRFGCGFARCVCSLYLRSLRLRCISIRTSRTHFIILLGIGSWLGSGWHIDGWMDEWIWGGLPFASLHYTWELTHQAGSDLGWYVDGRMDGSTRVSLCLLAPLFVHAYIL